MFVADDTTEDDVFKTTGSGAIKRKPTADTSFHTVITKQERVEEENINETWKRESLSFNFKAFQSDHTYCQHEAIEICINSACCQM